MRILTIDPGYAALGYAVLDVTAKFDRVTAMGVVRTKVSSNKRILKNEDSFARMRHMAEELEKLSMRGTEHSVRALVFESLSLPQQTSKQAAVKIGMPYGLLAQLAATLNIPVVMVTPQRVKNAVCGADNASKHAVEIEMRKRFLPAKVRGGVINDFLSSTPASLHNHAWDALAVYVASTDMDVMKALLHGSY
jgi:Holliday junction resolvasome RuvABC endonuclease subunit